MTYKSIILVSFITTLIACGEGTTSEPIPPPTLTFTSSNLDQIKNHVPKNIRQIAIQVAEDLDPDSINNISVHLMAGDGENQLHDAPLSAGESGEPSLDSPEDEPDVTGSKDTIDGKVWFDEATRTIYFEPRQTLTEGITYHIRIHDVKLKDGRNIVVEPKINDAETGVIQFSFTTSHLHEVMRIQYDQQGMPNSYVTFRTENNILKERRHFSTDKELKFILQYNYMFGSGRLTTLLYRNGQDEITQYYYDVIEAGVTIASVRATKPGVDLEWGTEDDLVASWSQPKQQHLTHSITNNYTLIDLSTPVPWTGIGSTDFRLKSIYLTEHGGNDFQHRNIFYQSLGANGAIDVDPTTQNITAIDDEITLWHRGDFENGKRIRSWSLKGTANSDDSGVGADGLLFTDDDIATGLTTLEYYPEIPGSAISGLLRKITTYYQSNFSAPQDAWFTDKANNIVNTSANPNSNTILYSYTLYKYDQNGTTQETIRYFPGADGLMASEQELSNNTADDFIVQRRTYSTETNIDGESLL